jgi:hypothetical protein
MEILNCIKHKMMSMVMSGNTKTMFTKTILVPQMLTRNPHNIIYSKKVKIMIIT